jgi:hypothetical protein
LWAASALKLRVKDWMILHSEWTQVVQGKNYYLYQSIYTVMSYHKFKEFKRQTTQRAVSFVIEDYESTNGF